MTTQKALYLCLLALCLTIVNGQSIPLDYGEIEDSWFDIQAYPDQADAGGIVFLNFGQLYGMTSSGQERMVREFVLKAKVLDEASIDYYANWKLPYYSEGDQDFDFIIAQSYNKDANGKVNKTKLDKDHIYTEKLGDGFSQKVFSIPNVQVGSIIELKYVINSPLSSSSRPFDFQLKDPVVHTEFRYQNPKFVTFTTLTSGMNAKDIKISNQVNLYEPRYTGVRNWEVYTYSTDSLLGISMEPYVKAIDDYFTKLQFQVYSFDNGQFVESFSQTWEELSAQMNADIDEQLNAISNKQIFKDLEHLFNKGDSDYEKIEAVFNYIRGNFYWNGRTQINIKDSRLKETYQNKKGSSSQLNMMMAYLLQKLEVPITPVLCSTVNNGRVMPEYPYKYQFNNLVWFYDNTEKPLILDIRDYNRPFDIIPADLLSTLAILCGEDKTSSLSIMPSFKWEELTLVNIADIDEAIEGNVRHIFSGYAMVDYRRTESEEDCTKKYIEDQAQFKIDNIELKSYDDIDEKLSINYDFSTKNFIIKDGEEIFINPLLSFALNDNPFKANQRILPVEFGYPLSFERRVNLRIPEGYELVELPENSIIQLGDQAITLKQQYQSNAGGVQILMKFDVNQILFQPEQYSDVQEFFKTVVKKNNEFIVLKKQS